MLNSADADDDEVLKLTIAGLMPAVVASASCRLCPNYRVLDPHGAVHGGSKIESTAVAISLAWAESPGVLGELDQSVLSIRRA